MFSSFKYTSRPLMMESALDFTRGVRTCSAVVFEVFAIDGAPDTDAADAVARRAVFTDIIRARVGAVARRDMRGGLWSSRREKAARYNIDYRYFTVCYLRYLKRHRADGARARLHSARSMRSIAPLARLPRDARVFSFAKNTRLRLPNTPRNQPDCTESRSHAPAPGRRRRR